MQTRNFVREIVEPSEERRRMILRKLASLRGVPRAEQLVGSLRKQLKACDGYTRYYRIHKNVKIPICDNNVSRKYLMLGKDPGFMQPHVREYRQKHQSISKIDRRTHSLKETRFNLFYNKIGGVMVDKGVFFRENRKINTHKISQPKKPKTKDFYIGLEIEYASSMSISNLLELLLDAKLHDNVRVVRDGSIRTNDIYKHQVEFCILAKFSELENILNRLKPIVFDRPDIFSPNNSCGLHVHLDARHGRVGKIFHNLACVQTVLFALAKDNRRENPYCVPVTNPYFDEGDQDSHYDAISRSSFHKHGTVEVRIHHSTLNLTQIIKWVKLLKTVADYNGSALLNMGSFDSEFNQLKNNLELEPELVKYIEERNVL